MKLVLQLSMLVLVLFACEKKEDALHNSEIVGQWQLTQILLDPGDGSGTFMDIKSTKVITFNPDLSIEVLGGFCGVDTSTDGVSKGTYDPLEKTIAPEDCVYDANFPIRITYSIEEGYLYVYFPCIEPCAQKYRRLE
jgi:hypothetical protein